jgi:hypothetical protein
MPETKATLRALLNSSQESMLLIDTEGTLLALNDIAA